jgi:hypothetical protein
MIGTANYRLKIFMNRATDVRHQLGLEDHVPRTLEVQNVFLADSADLSISSNTESLNLPFAQSVRY